MSFIDAVIANSRTLYPGDPESVLRHAVASAVVDFYSLSSDDRTPVLEEAFSMNAVYVVILGDLDKGVSGVVGPMKEKGARELAAKTPGSAVRPVTNLKTPTNEPLVLRMEIDDRGVLYAFDAKGEDQSGRGFHKVKSPDTAVAFQASGSASIESHAEVAVRA